MMYKIFSFVLGLTLLLSLSLSAQELNVEDFNALKFRNIGPSGMSGRITAIDVDLSDTDRIFIGSASGGVWKSENGGITWDPIFDNQPTLSIGSLKINQNNPSEIWVGTGEGNPRNSHNSGRGIFKTIDGGKTWNYMGLEATRLIHRIIINEQNPNEVLVGAMGSAWGPTSDRGVYKTVDGGKNWEKILFVNKSTGVADMVQDPKNPNKILAAMWEFGRTPWDFTSGGEGSGMYLTYDGGANWKKLGTDEGMPEGILGRIGMAIAPSKPNIIYALIEAKENGFYKSVDGGENWNLVSKKEIGNRPFYYSEIYVDPSNENRIFNLWSYVSKSEDGGKSFKNIMDYGNAVHPDHHAFWIDPNDPSYMINGNDGGLNISRDGGENWRFVPNLPVGQFYHVAVDNDFPYNVYGGMQDNGSWIGPGFALKSGGITEADWQELYFGDGFDVAAIPGNSRYGYAMSQGGNIGYYDRETGRTQRIRPQVADSLNQRFNWNAALALDPFDENGLYYCSQYVHYSNDRGQSWKTISEDLTTNNPDKLKQDVSGGLTIDATNAENHCTILAVAPSPHDKDVIWASTDDGQLHITKDGGSNWQNISSRLIGAPDEGWIPQIELSQINEGEAFIVLNNYRKNDWSAYLYHTNNFGQTFTRIVNDNDVSAFVCSVIQDPKEENLLFLGTDAGLYFSIDKGSKWIKWGEDMPNVQIRDMKIQTDFDDLVLGTFGRSFWILDDIRPLRSMAKEGKALMNNKLVLFDAGDAYKAFSRSYQGVRFYAQGTFVGGDKRRGAQIKYWMKPKKDDESDSKAPSKTKSESKSKKKSKKKAKNKAKDLKEVVDSKEENKKEEAKEEKEKPTLVVLNNAGDTMRTLHPKLKEGLNSITWGLDAKGVKTPTRGDFYKKDTEPGGGTLAPGKYKLVLRNGDAADSTYVNVKLDPRVEIDENEINKSIAASKDFEKYMENATSAWDQLQDGRKRLKTINTLLELQEDTVKKEFKILTKDLSTEIDSLENLFMMPEGVKGIQRNPKNLGGLMWRARSFFRSSTGEPSPNAEIAINKFKMKATEVIEGCNTFFQNDWRDFESKFEALQLDILGEFEPVKIE